MSGDSSLSVFASISDVRLLLTSGWVVRRWGWLETELRASKHPISRMGVAGTVGEEQSPQFSILHDLHLDFTSVSPCIRGIGGYLMRDVSSSRPRTKEVDLSLHRRRAKMGPGDGLAILAEMRMVVLVEDNIVKIKAMLINVCLRRRLRFPPSSFKDAHYRRAL